MQPSAPSSPDGPCAPRLTDTLSPRNSRSTAPSLSLGLPPPTLRLSESEPSCPWDHAARVLFCLAGFTRRKTLGAHLPCSGRRGFLPPRGRVALHRVGGRCSPTHPRQTPGSCAPLGDRERCGSLFETALSVAYHEAAFCLAEFKVIHALEMRKSRHRDTRPRSHVK